MHHMVRPDVAANFDWRAICGVPGPGIACALSLFKRRVALVSRLPFCFPAGADSAWEHPFRGNAAPVSDRFGCSVKDWRHIPTRYDNPATNYMVCVFLAAAITFW